MLTTRQKEILKIIVEEYVRTAEPVGSKSICDRLKVSSATVRNEMAALEKEGYLDKTHSSSGRVPLEKGYKYYVEELLTADDEVFENKAYELVDNIFSNKIVAREDAIKKACSLLSDITNYTTVVLGPDSSVQKVSKIELIHLSQMNYLMMVVTDLGHVETKQVSFDEDEVDSEELLKVMDILNDVLKGTALSDVYAKLNYILDNHLVQEFLIYRDSIIQNFLNAFMKFTETNYYVSGSSNMLIQPEFQDQSKLKKLIDILEKKELIKIIKETTTDSVSIRIGSETGLENVDNATIISVPYENDKGEKGTVALVGPSRMDYKKVIPLIEYIAKDITKTYKK